MCGILLHGYARTLARRMGRWGPHCPPAGGREEGYYRGGQGLCGGRGKGVGWCLGNRNASGPALLLSTMHTLSKHAHPMMAEARNPHHPLTHTHTPHTHTRTPTRTSRPASALRPSGPSARPALPPSSMCTEPHSARTWTGRGIGGEGG